MAHHVIIGGSGFIGRHVVLLLAQQRHDITIMSRNRPDFAFPFDVRWGHGDIASASWDDVIGDADVVHYYACTSWPASANNDPSADLSANVQPILRLLDAAQRHGCRVVFASSGGAVYGVTPKEPVPEEHPLAPITAYGAGKAAAEIYLNLYHSLHGLDCRIARLANPYGAGQNTKRGQGAVSAFLGKALRNEPIVIWGDGSIVRDYIHITDAAAGLVRIAQASDLGNDRIFNIGSGVGHSLNDIIKEIEIMFDRGLNVEYTTSRSFDVPTNVLSIKRAQTILGWQPRLSFHAGLRRTLSDMKAGRPLSSL